MTKSKQTHKLSPLLLSKKQVAHLLGICEATVDVFVASGELRRINMGAGTQRPQWKYERTEVDRFIAARRSASERQEDRREASEELEQIV